MTATVFVAICHETSCLSLSISLASLSSLLPPPPPPPHMMSILSSPPKMSVTKSYSFSSFSRRWSTCPSLVKWDTAKGQCISSTSPHAHFVLCPNNLFSLPSLLDKNVLSLRNHQIWSPVINVQMCFTVFLWTLFSMILHVFSGFLSLVSVQVLTLPHFQWLNFIMPSSPCAIPPSGNHFISTPKVRYSTASLHLIH